MQRIRYKEELGALVSPVMFVGPVAYKAIIDTTAKQVSVYRQDEQIWTNIYTQPFRSMHQAKKMLKAELSNLGVEFQAERRVRGEPDRADSYVVVDVETTQTNV